MNEMLITSISINVIFLFFFGYYVNKKGGITYVKKKLGVLVEPPLLIKDDPDWKDRKTLFEILPNGPDEIIFLGDSHIDRCEWAELFNNPSIKNRGIGGDDTGGILDRLSAITKSHPKKIFIQIGGNDLDDGKSLSEIVKNFELIIYKIKEDSPLTKIFFHSVFPLNNNEKINNELIIALNAMISKLAINNSMTFINLYDKYLDRTGELNMQLSHDGIHLNGKGYLIWKDAIEKFVNEA
jgi:lysophospholipase L1-like esterase